MSRYVATIGPHKPSWIGKWIYNLAGFRKYGLFIQDIFDQTPETLEAVKRLPPDVFEARNRRMQIADHLYFIREELPKEQWTKYEEDVKYLTPYLNEVRREWAEKNNWNRDYEKSKFKH